MPRKNDRPAIGNDLRIRVSVEIDNELACAIEEIQEYLRKRTGRHSVSQVIRAAIRDFYQHGEWLDVLKP